MADGIVETVKTRPATARQLAHEFKAGVAPTRLVCWRLEQAGHIAVVAKAPSTRKGGQPAAVYGPPAPAPSSDAWSDLHRALTCHIYTHLR